jgi:hypothetical protein
MFLELFNGIGSDTDTDYVLLSEEGAGAGATGRSAPYAISAIAPFYAIIF